MTDIPTKRGRRFPTEVRARSVRMVFECEDSYSSRWAAIQSVASKVGCTPETLRTWLLQQERDEGKRDGPSIADKQRLKDLERENKELRQANEILRKASAFFAQAELDRRFKL